MLRKVRLTFAFLFFTAITLLFLDFTGTIHHWLGWTAKMQFLPAVLALNLGVVLFLVIATFVFGRIYCSIVCPLGVMQDIVSWFSGRRKGKKNRFSYSVEKKLLRYGVLTVFIIALIAGVGSLVALLAPYSSYGRIANNLFSPIYQLGNNFLAYLAERADSYAFYETEVWIKSVSTFVIAALTFIIISILAWKNGRTYCNTICPVGTVLSFISRFSILRPVIDTEKCKNCKLCERRCKSACINIKEHQIDYSRCVSCMNCIDNCKHDAIHYSVYRKKADKKAPQPENTKNEKIDESRRSFMTATAMAIGAATIKAQEQKVDGGLATIEDKKIPKRNTRIVPPGALSISNFASHCTACQLCVSACPNGVLRPSTGLMTLMQPEMSYERGYCRPECNKCSEVCPAGAILPISIADKSVAQIGHAVWVRKNCIPLTDDVECGNCARHCPSGAIQMVPSDASNPKSRKIPVVNEEKCIGCGACENLCPARPFSAIYVEGHETHKVL